VANNDPDWPTVSFIGPGTNGDVVLYVASDFTSDKVTEFHLRQNATGVSSRSLSTSNTFQIANYVVDVESGSLSGTFAMVNFDAAVNSRVRYVDGFSWNGFSYFFTVQPLVYSEISEKVFPMGSKVIQVIGKLLLFTDLHKFTVSSSNALLPIYVTAGYYCGTGKSHPPFSTV